MEKTFSLIKNQSFIKFKYLSYLALKCVIIYFENAVVLMHTCKLNVS